MELSISGVPVAVVDAYVDFWQKVGAGTWEPETFALFDKYIDKETTVVDIGAWIGSTAIYAAHLGRRVYAFEPDPAAFDLLQKNVALNPGIGEIIPINAAITTDGNPARLLTTEGFGNSLTSLVRGTSEDGRLADSKRLAPFLDEHEVSDRLFVKMDVEGYEFELCPDLLSLFERRDTTLLVSLHPQFIVRSARRSVLDKVRNRLQFARRVAHLFWPMRHLRFSDESGNRVSPLRVIADALLHGSLRLGDQMLVIQSATAAPSGH